MTHKKYKQYIMLLTLSIALYLIIYQKHYIEKITNNFLYLEEMTLPPDKEIKR